MKKINSNLFKLAMSKFATGVTVITININGSFLGKTINSFASLSLSPPLILFSLDRKSSSLMDYQNSKYIGINILSDNQRNISNYFSNKKPNWNDTGKFLSKNNIPMIEGSVANINSKKIKTIEEGDHVIFICKINEILIDNKKKPLIYLDSKYL